MPIYARLGQFVRGALGGVPNVHENAEDILGLSEQLFALVVSPLCRSDSILRTMMNESSLRVTGTIGSDDVDLVIS